VSGWKNILKGIFDAAQEHHQFIITGSSKLDVFRKAGDSFRRNGRGIIWIG